MVAGLMGQSLLLVALAMGGESTTLATYKSTLLLVAAGFTFVAAMLMWRNLRREVSAAGKDPRRTDSTGK